jgi:glucose/arabinose dehydrogenase
VDDRGRVYVAEAGLPFAGATPGGRVLRIGLRGHRDIIASDLRPPVNGLTYHDGALLISEGGHPARISRLDLDGQRLVPILEGLPGPGNYHTNMTCVGADGRLYFGQGAMTNSGVVGLDAYDLGWLRRLPHAHDIPGYNITLSGAVFETANPFDPRQTGIVRTGAFSPFGEEHPAGTTLRGKLPCTAAVMSCRPDGNDLRLVAWGLRNAYGLGFLPDGRLLCTDQGADDRGSRPIGNAPDLLFHVRQGAWYGWPDLVGGRLVDDDLYTPDRGPTPPLLLANHHELPPAEQPLLRFPPHVAAVKFTVTPANAPWPGQIIVALFGDERPLTAPPGTRSGRCLARIDPSDWTLHDLFDGEFKRPIDVHVDHRDGSLLVLDFGHFEMTSDGLLATPGSGSLWRVSFEATPHETAESAPQEPL